MAPTSNNSKIPHALRFAIFLLRLALGLDFLYLGLGTVYEPAWPSEFRSRSLGDLYLWLGNVSNAASLQTVFAWAFLIVGACLILGFGTRLASIAGIVVVGASFIPNLSYTTLNVSQFVSDGIIAGLCLLVLCLANAGTYLGLDQFIHFHVGKRHTES
jgi:thiosulfate dehydrogenase [quinone] large subunit